LASAASGRPAEAASVIRRPARTPSGSSHGTSGASPGHQVTTGASGSSSGRTTLSAWPASLPCSRSSSTSPGPASPATRISASSRGSERPGRRITPMIRDGCSWAASEAARIAS
jgi:hypothetical protein